MTGFQLDTSGSVRRPGFARPLVWSDLSAFEQGYVRALFTDYQRRVHGSASAGLRFSDLAPETLALILKDCERYEHEALTVGLWAGTPEQARAFWAARQTGNADDFPALIPTLSDDGKIYLRQAQEAQS